MRNKFLTVEQFARETQLTCLTIRRWIAQKRIAITYIGPHTLRIPESELGRLFANGAVPARDTGRPSANGRA